MPAVHAFRSLTATGSTGPCCARRTDRSHGATDRGVHGADPFGGECAGVCGVADSGHTEPPHAAAEHPLK